MKPQHRPYRSWEDIPDRRHRDTKILKGKHACRFQEWRGWYGERTERMVVTYRAPDPMGLAAALTTMAEKP